MELLFEQKRKGKFVNADGSPGFKLVYIDLPRRYQARSRGERSEKTYQDRVAGSEFLEFIRRHLILIRELLLDDGVLFMHAE